MKGQDMPTVELSFPPDPSSIKQVSLFVTRDASGKGIRLRWGNDSETPQVLLPETWAKIVKTFPPIVADLEH